jgi:TRAP-type C4-dicarboxylate transport system permease small subunit
MIEKVLKWVDACSKLGAYLSAGCMLAIVGLIVVEIICRSFFHVSTFIADEYSGYLMVAAVMAGLGFTLETDSHIKISILLVKVSPEPRRYIELMATLVAISITFFAFYHAVLMVYDTYSYDMLADSISETPLYIPQFLIPVGLLALMLQLVAQFIRRLPFCSQNR